MKNKRINTLAFFLAFTVICFSYIVEFHGENLFDSVTDNALCISRFLLEVALIFAWCKSIRKRIVNKKVSDYLISIGRCMAIWLSLRVIKYCFLPPDNAFHRFCWYAYYFVLILIPLFCVFITDYIGKAKDYVAHNNKKILYLAALFLILTVFTNDFHQLVFTFPKGIEFYDTDYTFNVMQYVNAFWIISLSLYFVIKVRIKSHVPGRKSAKILPFFIVFSAVSFWMHYIKIESVRKIDGVSVGCFIIICFLESLIRNGQIRSNMNYATFLSELSSSVWIVDKDYNVIYKSQVAMELNRTLMKNAEDGDINLGDTCLHNRKIDGGRVLWESDISEITKILEELIYTEREISDENSLINSEIVLKEQKAHFEEQNRLYDRMSEEAKPSFKKISVLCREAEKNGFYAKKNLSQIAFIGSYIKRRSNLFILKHENEFVNSRELELCFKESLDNLRLSNVYVSFDFDCDGDVLTQNAIEIYDTCEKIIEDNFDILNSAMFRLSVKDGNITAKLNLGLDGSFTKSNFSAQEKDEVEILIDEYDVFITVKIPSGGEKA